MPPLEEPKPFLRPEDLRPGMKVATGEGASGKITAVTDTEYSILWATFDGRQISGITATRPTEYGINVDLGLVLTEESISEAEAPALLGWRDLRKGMKVQTPDGQYVATVIETDSEGVTLNWHVFDGDKTENPMQLEHKYNGNFQLEFQVLEEAPAETTASTPEPGIPGRKSILDRLKFWRK